MDDVVHGRDDPVKLLLSNDLLVMGATSDADDHPLADQILNGGLARFCHGQLHLTRIRPNFWVFQEKCPFFGSNPA